VITDEDSESAQPCAVLTGDTLFIGDVGRPDLSRTHTPRELAGLLYDSLHQKLLTLPDAVTVYPAHGAGSLCGRAMRAERSSTIGHGAAYELCAADREPGRIYRAVDHQPSGSSRLFSGGCRDQSLGRGDVDGIAAASGLSPAEVQALLQQNANVLDVRPGDAFAAGHVPGSISIALSGQFASWAGGILGIHSKPVLIGETDAQIEEARLRLARVGIEDLRGYLAGGVRLGRRLACRWRRRRRFPLQELNQKLRGGSWRAADVLDVRREGEWQAGHIAEVQCRALDTFPHGIARVGQGSARLRCTARVDTAA
jgi:hydroxyacylglutathione hydrolase